MPAKFKDVLCGKNRNNFFHILTISGILLVTGAVLVIMYNTDLLLRLILLILGRSARVAPVLGDREPWRPRHAWDELCAADDEVAPCTNLAQ